MISARTSLSFLFGLGLSLSVVACNQEAPRSGETGDQEGRLAPSETPEKPTAEAGFKPVHYSIALGKSLEKSLKKIEDTDASLWMTESMKSWLSDQEIRTVIVLVSAKGDSKEFFHSCHYHGSNLACHSKTGRGTEEIEDIRSDDDIGFDD